MDYSVVDDEGFLGQRFITGGNTEKLRLFFCQFLDEGVTVVSAVPTSTSATSPVSAATLSDDRKTCWCYVSAGVNFERFDITLVVTFSDGQVFKYTVAFTIRC